MKLTTHRIALVLFLSCIPLKSFCDTIKAYILEDDTKTSYIARLETNPSGEGHPVWNIYSAFNGDLVFNLLTANLDFEVMVFYAINAVSEVIPYTIRHKILK